MAEAYVPARSSVASASTGSYLYVSNHNAIEVFAPNGTTPIRSYYAPPEAFAFALDANGKLFIAKWGPGHGFVAVHKPGSTSLERTISDGVYHPAALAFDAAGNVYIANDGNGTVTVYAPGKAHPFETINGVASCGKHCLLAKLAFDRKGNLYVFNQGRCFSSDCRNSSIAVYSPGKTAPSYFIDTSGIWVVTMVVNQAGYVYTISPVEGEIAVYAPGETKRLRTISKGLCEPFDGAVDAADNLYVTNYIGCGSNSKDFAVTIYDEKGLALRRRITAGLSYPSPLAFDPAGNLYVGNAASVTVYAPNSVTPMRTITSGVDAPGALIFGSQ